jgi:hypothetical protein
MSIRDVSEDESAILGIEVPNKCRPRSAERFGLGILGMEGIDCMAVRIEEIGNANGAIE